MQSVPEAIRDDPGGQPVESVDEVDRVRERDDPQRGDEREDARSEHERAGEGDLELLHRRPGEVQDARGEDLAGDLGRRGHAAEVVDEADDEDHPAREDHAHELVGRHVDDVQGGDERAEPDRDAQPREHRDPAAVGRDARVHGPIARHARGTPPCARSTRAGPVSTNVVIPAVAAMRTYQPSPSIRTWAPPLGTGGTRRTASPPRCARRPAPPRRRGDAATGRSARRSAPISSGPIPAVVSAALPRRSPDVTNGLRGSSGIWLRLSVIPARSRTSWASLPVSSASKSRRSTSRRWLSVPPVTSRNPSASRPDAERGGVARRRRGRSARTPGVAASRNATAFAAITCSRGPPWSPGNTAESIALACSSRHTIAPPARSAQRLVGREGDDVGVRDGVRVHPAGDEAGDVGHVEHQQRPHLVGDLAERLGLDEPRVRRRARDDEPRALGLGAVAHLVEVDPLARVGPVEVPRRDPVGDEPPDLGGDRRRRAVREVPAVVEPHGEHGVAGLEERLVDGEVRAGTGVRLHVGVVRAEQRGEPRPSEVLDLVDRRGCRRSSDGADSPRSTCW